jgi:hypothetical protein
LNLHARIIAGYPIDHVPARWLPYMAMMQMQAENIDGMQATAARIATDAAHPNPELSLNVLERASKSMQAARRIESALMMWKSIPADSDLQPRALRDLVQMQMWWAGDVAGAVKSADPANHRPDTVLRRMYGQALVLAGRADEGRKVLESIGVDPRDQHRQAALSGAMARTIEYNISEKDWETGEDNCDRWEGRYPTTFLEGYSVLLRVKLMELKGVRGAAAKVAEAFANAVPQSPYAPQLLDRASNLLARDDPKKSAELHDMLKTRYPEDPLSQ